MESDTSHAPSRVAPSSVPSGVTRVPETLNPNVSQNITSTIHPNSTLQNISSSVYPNSTQNDLSSREASTFVPDPSIRNATSYREPSLLPAVDHNISDTEFTHDAELEYDDDDFLNTLLTADIGCLLYTSPSPRDLSTSRMPSSA